MEPSNDATALQVYAPKSDAHAAEAAEVDYSKLPEYDLEPTPEPVPEDKQKKLADDARRYKQLFDELQKNFYEHSEFFVVSVRWLNRWKVYVGFNETNSDLPPSSRIGAGKLPTLNEDILQEGWLSFNLDAPYEHLNKLIKAELKEHTDYELVSGEMWQLLSSYSSSHAIPRYLEKTLDGKKVEVHYKRIPAAVAFNEYMREIERQYVSTLKRVNFQLPQYRPLEPEMIAQISAKVKSFVKKEFGFIANNVDFTTDAVKVWISNEELTEKQLLNAFYKACKANISYSYKVFFPGVFADLAEPLCKLDLPATSIVVLELRQTRDEWMFYNRTSMPVAKCDSCKYTEQLTTLCPCNFAIYCSKECKNKDKASHRYRCPRDAESSEDEKQLQFVESSRRGIMGLRNLGNTCFMNSGIQCVTSVNELTQYFLSGRYLGEINLTNKIGTKGELSKAYGKLIQKMWYGEDSSVSPSVLKQAIGKFQPMFLGYDQHDSGELISYLLDGLHEDLNRVKDKPYTESKDYDGRPDDVLARESWEMFLKRNQSIIVDLMYGQYKSRLDCPKCQKVSVMFDPFLMLPVPIPQNNTKTIELKYVPDHIRTIKLDVQYDKLKNPKLQDIIDVAVARLGLTGTKMIVCGSSYYSSDLIDSSLSANEQRKEYKHKSIVIRPMEADEDPQSSIRVNTTLTLCHSQWGNETHRRNITRQRTYLFPPSFTAKQVHLRLASYFKSLLEVQDYEKEIIEAAPEEQKWRLLLVNRSSYDPCPYCDKTGCYGCSLPFDDSVTVEQLWEKSKKARYETKLEIDIFWRKNAEQIERTFEKVENFAGKEDAATSQSNEAEGPVKKVDIYDCLRLSQQPETLEEDNAWYCPSCKDFVLAKKQMQVYKAPKILIIYFKRFKGKGYKGLIKSKDSTLIDFPIEGLDMSEYILNHSLPNEDQPGKGPVKYSLFAISNHFGGLGGGHYTAYARKEGSRWYEFDDGSAREASEDRLVSSSSYVLFYRRNE